ncbi:MAG: glycosyltransferase family 9 protein [Bacteroidetes bacterium]|nr:MAG: glycosyltransferase family 9 protein [Bacteroidota bacterium]
MKQTPDFHGKTILISRTDSIGDVVLTLPICSWIKKQFPESRILFLCRSYTKAVVSCYLPIDEIICWDDLINQSEQERIRQIKSQDIFCCIHVFPNKDIARLMHRAKVPHRIGTSHRSFHLLTCNHRVSFTRKRSELHESALSFNLCKPLGLEELPSLKEISQWTSTHFQTPDIELPPDLQSLSNFVVLHPKSQGSALEWPLENYIQLSRELISKGYTAVFTGTEKEGLLFRDQLPHEEKCLDLSGRLSLEQLIVLISQAKALVACSTGPYHLAGVTGIRAIGLFSSRRPIHPGRWKALGLKATFLVNDPECPTCKKGEKCHCIEKISVDQVLKSV